MGQVKKKLMEYEENVSILDELISIYSSNIIESLDESEIVLQLLDLRERIRSIDNKSFDTIELMSELINEEIHSLYYELVHIFELLQSNNEHSSKTAIIKFRKLTKTLQIEIRKINGIINNYLFKTKNIYNVSIR